MKNEIRAVLLSAALSISLAERGNAQAAGGNKLPARDGVVLDVAGDGSILRILEPWTLASWDYMQRIRLAATSHTFRKGPVVAELALLRRSQRGKDAGDMAKSLAARYSKKTGRVVEAQPIRLSNGLLLSVIATVQKIEGRRQYVWEGYLKKDPADPRTYYYIVVCPLDKIDETGFRAAATVSLRVLGTLKL